MGLCFFQDALEVFHVGILVAITFGFAESNAVDDGGMVQSIADDGIFFSKERFEYTAVGIEACRIEDSIFGVEVFGNGFLQFFVDVLRSANEAYGAHPESTLIHRILGSLYQPRVIGQTEIVVGTKVQYLLAFVYADVSTLGGDDDPFFLVQPGFFDTLEFGSQVVFHSFVHSTGVF